MHNTSQSKQSPAAPRYALQYFNKIVNISQEYIQISRYYSRPDYDSDTADGA